MVADTLVSLGVLFGGMLLIVGGVHWWGYRMRDRFGLDDDPLFDPDEFE